jgi:hypothetical protein
MVMLWATVKVPPAGEKVGVAAAGRLMVKAPLATALVLKPEAMAIALMVVVAATEIGEEYFVEAIVGVEPSVV